MISPEDDALLRLWGQSWTYTGRRDQAVTEETGLTPTRAAQRVNALLDDRDALEAHPAIVNRLRRIRDQQRRSRPVPGG